MGFTNKVVACLLAFILLMFILNVSSSDVIAAALSMKTEPDSHQQVGDGNNYRIDSYTSYIVKYTGEPSPDIEIVVKGSEYISDHGANVEIRDYEGKDNVLYWASQEGSVEWKVVVPRAGLYNMSITYCAIPGKNNNIKMRLYIDGQIPFSGVDGFELTRVYKNETNDFAQDSRGNQLRPRQVEVLKWITAPITDAEGRHNDPFKFYFSEGEHTIRLEIISEALAIDEIKLYQANKPQSYDQPDMDLHSSPSGIMDIYEAEFTYEKSSPTLYPTEDRGNPATSPSHPYSIRYNTVGKTTFRHPGQWISWKFDIPEDGYYYIAFKVRQNVKRGMYSTRRIYIDGQVPFAELDNVKFPYSIKWYTKILGDQKPFLFYFEKGLHEIKMEVVTGEIAEILEQLEEIIYEMNGWYRKIVMITGANPDSSRQVIDENRDYLLDERIPGLIQGFEDIANRLQAIKEKIDVISIDKGNTASFLMEVVAQLRSFVREPETIPRRLDSYKGNISSLSTLVLDMREQPLEIDYFAVLTPDMVNRLPRENAGFFETLLFRTKMFMSTFVRSYNNIGEVYAGDPLDVWVSTSEITMAGISSGRDQAQIIKSMVDDLFVPSTNIGVNISLVNSSEALIQAILAGKGPDVALFISKETPVNLGIRGALVDFTQFDDFEDVASRFHESALIPYYFNGKCYAIPETQNFDVLFYRTDIFEELGLEPPETWDDFYAMIATLQINNMMIGIPENQRTFEMLVFQHGGSFYSDDLTKTAFDRPEVLEAFKQWTGLYSKYGLPLTFDFFNRFRTGEMPVAIMPYTQSNYLMAAAPEIKNLWAMAPVPGVKKDDGSINNAVTSYGTGSIAIKSDEEKERKAWEFIKWWTSAEVQARFGNELELLMGPAARYPTANVEAFDMLPWDYDQAKNLKRQWERVTDVPQVPGNYYINRNIMFAFRAVVLRYENEREVLNKYNKEINKEIERKRIEFGLSVE